MENLDFSDVNTRLRGDAQYQAALNGEINIGGFPTGPDGRVLPGFRLENARAYAEGKLGRENVPGGTINSKGEFSDPNATHWYSSPAFWGPIAALAPLGVAALGGIGGGAGAAAPAAYTGTAGTAGAAGGTGAAVGTGVGVASGAAGGMTTLQRIMNVFNNPFVASAVGGALTGIFGGDDGGPNPFTGQVAPQKTLEQSQTLLKGALGDAVKKSEQPTKLRSSYVQSPPSFSGFGLPMTIGVTGSDPALQDPSLLEQPGNDNANLRAAMKVLGINL